MVNTSNVSWIVVDRRQLSRFRFALLLQCDKHHVFRRCESQSVVGSKITRDTHCVTTRESRLKGKWISLSGHSSTSYTNSVTSFLILPPSVLRLKRHFTLFPLKGIVHPQNKNVDIIYSPSCRLNPRLSFIFETEPKEHGDGNTTWCEELF